MSLKYTSLRCLLWFAAFSRLLPLTRAVNSIGRRSNDGRGTPQTLRETLQVNISYELFLYSLIQRICNRRILSFDWKLSLSFRQGIFDRWYALIIRGYYSRFYAETRFSSELRLKHWWKWLLGLDVFWKLVFGEINADFYRGLPMLLYIYIFLSVIKMQIWWVLFVD